MAGRSPTILSRIRLVSALERIMAYTAKDDKRMKARYDMAWAYGESPESQHRINKSIASTLYD